MQIWTSEHKGDDKIIAFFDKTIYKANPSSAEVERYVLELKGNSIPTSKALEIPLSYLREITMEEGQKYFDVHFGGDSNEQFIISDDKTRWEIFNHLKAQLPVTERIEMKSRFKSAKKPLIAMIMILILFLWTLFVAIDVESGTDYEVAGNYRSVAGIILMLAYLGVGKVVLIFGVLLGIAIFAFTKKFKASQPIHRLVITR
jgi:hypothetical protein